VRLYLVHDWDNPVHLVLLRALLTCLSNALNSFFVYYLNDLLNHESPRIPFWNSQEISETKSTLQLSLDTQSRILDSLDTLGDQMDSMLREQSGIEASLFF
jgi:hypothetical protein